ncbi:NmrA family transcriptional regulator [Mycobacterium sp. ACS1612]|uniref:NmrA/HSCARG family protein n=1 Tax=Mycobacterium sp. ACS1612 TaxID=1834117 RepID=UPI0007FF7861|nr:NmrA/HSCARG family protein [Mycobacterium sp. ACS1612]OBF27801.1 NmrA family transcriptional regulator [Mycobacterium sp. ACS1612]
MTEEPVLVLGATGGQGGAVTAALIERGARVRAMVRRPEGPSARRLLDVGVEVVAGSLDDSAALNAAMRGVAAVFALTTPFEAGVDAEVAQGRTILAAAVDSQIPHMVFSSVASADQHSGVPHFDSKAIIENELIATGLPYTVTAPTYFFDNALGGLDQLSAGILELPLPPDGALQQLARADLGSFVAKVLLDPERYVGQRIELAGDAVTPREMAAVFSEVLGRPVRHRQTPLDSIGNPDMHAMWRFLNGPGYRVDIEALRVANPDIAWTSFAEWARRTFETSRGTTS